MKFKPLGARAMVKEVEREQTTESGIVLPDTAKEKPQNAEVVAVGAHEDVKVSIGDVVVVRKLYGDGGQARRGGPPDSGRRGHPWGGRGVASDHDQQTILGCGSFRGAALSCQLRLFQTLTDISSENSSTVILPVPMDLFRPYLGGAANGGGETYRPPQVERQEKREAERRYEEAVGQACGEQEAMQELAPDGTNGRTPMPTEGAANLGEEEVPPGEEPPRTTGSS